MIPVEFIGFQEPQLCSDESEVIAQQRVLNANLIAQMVALAKGKSDSDPNKESPGNRTSTLILAKKLTPKVLGALVAFYENKVMFQGFLWNINSFDQEGVQLGKGLANNVINQQQDIMPELDALTSLFFYNKQG